MSWFDDDVTVSGRAPRSGVLRKSTRGRLLGLIAVVGVAGLAACAAPAERAAETDAAPASATSDSLADQDFAGLVDIGGGREIWAQCAGQGSPSVVLISGHGNGAEDWSLILDLEIMVRTLLTGFGRKHAY